MITVDQEIAKKNNIASVYQMGEPIPLPEGKDIYITVPLGVFRCNFNEGIFPEDRRFLQQSEYHPGGPHVIRYSEIAHLKTPRLSIEPHYPGEDKEVLIEFK